MQKDMKKLIAYSSIAHMGFVTLGVFVLWSFDGGMGAGLGITGGMVQMISHGLISGAMFLCVGVLYDRVHSREIADYGGVAIRCLFTRRSWCCLRNGQRRSSRVPQDSSASSW